MASKIDQDDLLRRGLAAYLRAGGEGRPNYDDSAVEKHKGKYYVVLRNLLRSDGEVVAIYRVRNDGMLKRMKRWPAELNEKSNSKGR